MIMSRGVGRCVQTVAEHEDNNSDLVAKQDLVLKARTSAIVMCQQYKSQHGPYLEYSDILTLHNVSLRLCSFAFSFLLQSTILSKVPV